MKRLLPLLLMACLPFWAGAQKKTSPAARTKKAPVKKETLVELTTDMGTLVLKLYDSTPVHRDNFIRLVSSGFYDSLLFHRVIDSFMIQGGDPNSKYAGAGELLGNGSAPGERLPAEFRTDLFHKKGALAAARDNNPAKASSNCQFYIVQGKVFNDSTLNAVECTRVRANNPSFSYTDRQREVYKTLGGTPHLDQNYTVFGEVVSGLEVIDKIARVPRDKNNRPLQDVRMKMRLLR